jgi:hypothetical protein
MLSALAGCKLVQSPTGSAGTTVPPATDPTPQVTAPTTVPTPPATVPAEPVEVQVCPSMTLGKWYGLRLRFHYSLSQETFVPGDTIIATVQVTFLSYSLDIAGSFADYLSPIAMLWHDNGYYGFTSHTNSQSLDNTPQTLNRGDTVTATYTFTVPEDAMEGQYYMTFSAFDTMVRFDAQTAEACPNFMVCGDLPDEVLIAMWGGDSSDPLDQSHFDIRWNNRYNLILYGVFDGVYVYIDEYSYTSSYSVYGVLKVGEPLLQFRIPALQTVEDPNSPFYGYQVVNNNGVPNVDSSKYKYLGCSQPDFTMGFNTTLRWKDLTFTAVGDWRHGGMMYSRTANIKGFNGNATFTVFN